MILDAQVHEPIVSGSWPGASQAAREEVLTEALLDAITAVGVDAVLLHPVRERSWAEHAASLHPRRIACVFHDDGSGAEHVGAARASGLQVGTRIILGMPRNGEEVARYRAGAYDDLLAALEEHSLPLFLMATWNIRLAADIAERFPRLTVILDHLGLPQPPTQPPDHPRFRALPEVLALARHPNVAIKVSGAPSLSVQRFPFADLGNHLRALIDAFGAERLMWGSDWSRFDGRLGFWRQPLIPADFDRKHSYGEALYWVHADDALSPAERGLLLGGSARRILGWPVN